MKRVVLLVVAFCMLFLVACGKEKTMLDDVKKVLDNSFSEVNISQENNQTEKADVPEEIAYEHVEIDDHSLFIHKYADGTVKASIIFDGKDLPGELSYIQVAIYGMITNSVNGSILVMTNGDGEVERQYTICIVENQKWSYSKLAQVYEGVESETRTQEIYNEIISAFDRIEDA